MTIKGKRGLSILIVLILLLVPISGAFAGENYTTLEFCSKGNEVSKLQQKLKNQGYYTIAVDGIYGKATEKAVIDFQKDNKLTIDGIAGKETQVALDKKITAGSEGTNSSKSYNEDDIFWLARIIEAEASG